MELRKKMLGAIVGILGLAAAFSATASATPVSENGRLQVSGSVIKNSRGKTFTMKGVCINWDWDDSKMIYGRDAYKTMRDKWGVNAVRVNTWPEITADKALPKLRRVINDASSQGLYVLVNFGIWYEDPNRADYKKNATDVFSALSKEYGSKGNVLYEICNESKGSWANIKKYADYMVPIIRKNDKNGIIVVGTPDFCTKPNIPNGSRVKDTVKGKSNIVYAVHQYGNWNWNEIKRAKNAGVPLLATEFSPLDGFTGKDPQYKNAESCLSYMNGAGIGRFVWALRDSRTGYQIIKSNAPQNGKWDDTTLSEHGRWMVKVYTGRTPLTSYSFAVSTTSSTATWSGKAIRPNPTVRNSGKTVSSKYYSVSYSNNVAVGKATITVTGKGPYAGCRGTATFLINPKQPAISKTSATAKSIKASWSRDAQATAYQIQWSTSGNFAGAKTATLNGSGKTSHEITGLAPKRNYFIRLRELKTIGKTTYYGKWSSVKQVKTK